MRKPFKPSSSCLLSGHSNLSRLVSTSLADLVVNHNHHLNQFPHTSSPSSSNSSPSPATMPTSSSSTSPMPSQSTYLKTVAPASQRIRVLAGVVLLQLFVMVMLVIDRRKLVAGITLLAFGFWFLEVLGFRVPWSSKNTLVSSAGGESELEFDDDGAGTVSYSDITGSERSSFDFEANDWDRRSVSKKKKLFKKLVSKKLLSKRVCNESTVIDSGNTSPRVSDDITEVATEENVLRFLAPAVVADRKRARAEIAQENVCREKSRSYQKFEFILVILLGLLRGKSVALILTLCWFLFCKFASFCSKRRFHSSV